MYLFIATIILINLLIAQMADTYGRVTADGQMRWLFERTVVQHNEIPILIALKLTALSSCCCLVRHLAAPSTRRAS